MISVNPLKIMEGQFMSRFIGVAASLLVVIFLAACSESKYKNNHLPDCFMIFKLFSEAKGFSVKDPCILIRESIEKRKEIDVKCVEGEKIFSASVKRVTLHVDNDVINGITIVPDSYDKIITESVFNAHGNPDFVCKRTFTRNGVLNSFTLYRWVDDKVALQLVVNDQPNIGSVQYLSANALNLQDDDKNMKTTCEKSVEASRK